MRAVCILVVCCDFASARGVKFAIKVFGEFFSRALS